MANIGDKFKTGEKRLSTGSYVYETDTDGTTTPAPTANERGIQLRSGETFPSVRAGAKALGLVPQRIEAPRAVDALSSRMDGVIAAGRNPIARCEGNPMKRIVVFAAVGLLLAYGASAQAQYGYPPYGGGYPNRYQQQLIWPHPPQVAGRARRIGPRLRSRPPDRRSRERDPRALPEWGYSVGWTRELWSAGGHSASAYSAWRSPSQQVSRHLHTLSGAVPCLIVAPRSAASSR